MIGDWVMAKKEPIRIATPFGNETVLHQLTLYGYTSDGAKAGPFLETELTPIPLTADILEKNGIKWLMSEPSGKRTYSCNEPPISCTFIPDRGWHLSAGPIGSTKLPFAEISKAYYVHELQHVIRDAKVNKEIVL